MEVFVCPSCRFPLWEPVTVSCGHSFCRRCLGEDSPSKCCVCGDKLVLLGSRTVQCSVVLCDLLGKCLDKETSVARLKVDLDDLLRSGKHEGALKTLQKGVGLAPDDLELRMCRSEVYVALQQYPEALKDLEMLCIQQPEGCEGFFQKGKVLLAIGHKSEALQQFQHCLRLNSKFYAAKYEIEKILTNDDYLLPGTVAKLKSAVSQNLKESNSGKDPTLLVPSEGESLQDIKQSQEVWQEETMSGQNLASLSLPEWLWKKSNSGVSVKKEEDIEKGATAETTGAKSTQDIRSLLSTSDLECSLCIRMFFEPVTTPCGHTFCKECVERSLDHRPNCPLCKQSLREYLKARKYSTTVVLEKLMSTVFPSQLADRRQIYQTEMAELSNLTKNIPIFVCTLAFPGIVCSLHVFEPRYRLMIRRCRETGTKMFGMCMSENGKSFADYGCMLEIQKIDFLPDGRSFVNTTGKRRFQVLRRGHKDGYNTADIEYLEDKKVEGEELTELQNLHDCTYELSQRFYENGYMTFRHSLMYYGPIPEKEEDIQASPDGPAWCWWLILTLPLDVTRKLAIFSDTSLKSRLTQLKNILNVILESSKFNS
ncbi:LON peptidase N-terminal domain and RING finger protein 1-like isoform X1 [Heteronotia binoei]|uniref:LON peptidase N-terminal domain and RING finger protein 1-like isoform X1 n=1 Tax=Heteronotia binoei TaxID=13085 RepID=UPI00292DFB4E|nr:LON peptidase N-terminal domain and RING finger protein 1-like isoform X1 [Heteronotia binoei]